MRMRKVSPENLRREMEREIVGMRSIGEKSERESVQLSNE